MAIANKECICSSCGDEIKTGAKITVKSSKNKPTEILCFRCHPESEAAKIRVEIPGKAFLYGKQATQRRLPFFARAK